MRALISIVLLMLVAVGCAEAHKTAAPGQKLYFAVEVYREGKMIAKPRLLGEDGKPLRAERRKPGATVSDYVLSLRPVQKGDRYQIDLDLALPDGVRGHSELSLLHGEVRKLELGHKPGDLAVWLTLMEVDSPEFRALMDLSEEKVTTTGSI